MRNDAYPRLPHWPLQDDCLCEHDPSICAGLVVTDKFSLNRLLQSTELEPLARRIAHGTVLVSRDGNAHRRTGITFAHIGKLNPLTTEHLEDLIACFCELAKSAPQDAQPVILGIAESGIVPAFAMYTACIRQGRKPTFFWTSRTSKSPLRFNEIHSHSPTHYIPFAILEKQTSEIWIVEDEITTGRTLLNLLEQLSGHYSTERIRIFSLLDARKSLGCNAPGIDSTSPEPNHSLSIPLPIESIFSSSLNAMGRKQLPNYGLSLNPSDCRLVIGEALALALPELLQRRMTCLQHVTLSPWQVDGVNVFSRLEVRPGYYLYNNDLQSA